MNEIIIKAKNIKKHDDFELHAQSPAFMLVKGKNDTGKTTVLEMIAIVLEADNKNKDLLKKGTKEGTIEGYIKTKDGDIFTTLFKIDANGKQSYTLIDKNGKKINSVTSIRNLLNYELVSPDVWFGWGLTAEGRRKQAAYLLNMQSDEFKKEIEDIDKKINTQTGILYIQRQEINKELEATVKVYNQLKLSDEQKENLKKKYKIIDSLDKLVKQKQILTDKIDDNKRIVLEKENLQNNINSLKNDLEMIREDLRKKEAELLEKENIFTGLKTLSDTEISQSLDKIKEYNEYIERGEKSKANILYLENMANQIKKSEDDMFKLRQEQTQYNNDIETLRQHRIDMFKKANLPERMVIEDGECYYIDDKNNLLPFTMKSVSFRKGSEQILELLLERNKHLPIIPLGFISEWDNEGRTKILELAKKYNAIIISDEKSESESIQLKIIEHE